MIQIWLHSNKLTKCYTFFTSEDRAEHKEIGYYQWTPLILVLQAFMYAFPSILWRFSTRHAGIYTYLNHCIVKFTYQLLYCSGNLHVFLLEILLSLPAKQYLAPAQTGAAASNNETWVLARAVFVLLNELLSSPQSKLVQVSI